MKRPPREPPIIAGKVPPHDLDAEAAVLSAILLKQDTLDQVAEILKSEHFYSEANGKIYEAAVELARMSQPIDTVQVASWLRDRERLAQIGGPAYLAQIVDATPAVAHVQAHARTVREKWRLRRLIAECQRVSAEGYGDVGAVQEFIDGAEQAIYELARTPEANSAQPLSQVLRAAFEQISKAAERGDRITGISTGYGKYDEKTAGLHDGDLTIIAARPGMGKTSFVLNLAVNVASPRQINVPGPNDRGYGSNERREPGFGVAVFSLEMPREQLATRMVCSEARVDVGKLRGGHLNPEDWRRLTEGASYLSMLPVWLDDTPAIGLLELRAKVRRMQAEYNRPQTADAPEKRMGLIVIDYLQLMSGRPNAQSREQEISEISRGLKQLAKELRVPVIALSQLNRAVETRAGKDKRPQLSDLRECVTGDTLVMLADGSRVPIADLVGQEPEVFAMSEDGRIVKACSDKVWRVGKRQVYDVALASGRRIRATAKHRLYAGAGWRRVSELAAGDRIAVARAFDSPKRNSVWTPARLGLLAHLIGDGSYLVHQPLRYTTACEEHAAFVERAAVEEFGAKVSRHAGRGNWFQLVIAGNGNRWHPKGVGKWLRDLGVHNQRSHDKRVPPGIFGLAHEQIGFFLRHLWATDGSIFVRPATQRGSHRIFFASCSEGLARDVTALLLRLGIVARIRATLSADARPLWSVDVSGADQIRFLDVVGAFGERALPAKQLRARLAATARYTNTDTLPVEVWQRIRASMRDRGVSTRAMAALRGTAYGGTAHFRFAPTREVVESYARLLKDSSLATCAEDTLFWDRIVSITPAGTEDVFDLTVPGPASWLADGIVSHNSGAIEQDADTIVFIYRDEYYNPDTTEQKGLAELIIAKQRNGPTGKVFTRFTSSCTRFDNLQPGDYPDFTDD